MFVFLQLPFIVLSIALLVLGLANEVAASVLGVELPVLAEVMGLSEAGVEAVIYASAIVAAGLGIVCLRLLPRSLAPMGAVGPHERPLIDPDRPDQVRVAHINDPLQSVYVAVIVIAGVLLFSSIS